MTIPGPSRVTCVWTCEESKFDSYPQQLSARLRVAVASPSCRRQMKTSPGLNLQWDWRLTVSNLMELWVAYDIYISISQMFNMRSIKGILGSVQWATLSEEDLYNTMLVSAILWNSLLYCTRQNCMPSCIVRVVDLFKCAAKTCHRLLARHVTIQSLYAFADATVSSQLFFSQTLCSALATAWDTRLVNRRRFAFIAHGLGMQELTSVCKFWHPITVLAQ